MVKYFFLLLMFLNTSTAQSQHVKRHTIRKQNTKCTAAFPECFIGHWKGKMKWMVAGKPVQEFTMQLIIQVTDSANQYAWQIMYGDSAQDNRPYILKPLDTAKGHWVVDENNGIILDSYVHGNSLHGAFTVQGNTIVDNYTVNGNEMSVEFFSIKLTDKKTTGNNTDDSPLVDSYRISSYQAGTLKRIGNTHAISR
jgi:hypothetical protein